MAVNGQQDRRTLSVRRVQLIACHGKHSACAPVTETLRDIIKTKFTYLPLLLLFLLIYLHTKVFVFTATLLLKTELFTQNHQHQLDLDDSLSWAT